MKDIRIDEQEDKSIFRRREPFAFMLWLGIFGISLMFFILTILYLIRKGSPNWEDFRIPTVFWVSTGVILLSSYTLHLANRAFSLEKFLLYRVSVGLTLFLGSVFVLLQVLGWQHLHQMGIFLDGSPSGAFLYIISGLHALHIIGGLVFLGMAFIEAIRYPSYVDSFISSVNPPKQLRLKLVTRYWHFVDILWIYLFLFFLYQHS